MTEPLKVSELAKNHWLIHNLDMQDVRQVVVSPEKVVLKLMGNRNAISFNRPQDLAAFIHMLLRASRNFDTAYYEEKVTQCMEQGE